MCSHCAIKRLKCVPLSAVFQALNQRFNSEMSSPSSQKRRLAKLDAQALADAKAERKLDKKLKKTQRAHDVEEDASITQAIKNMVMHDLEHAFGIKTHHQSCDHWWHHTIADVAGIHQLFKVWTEL